MVSYDETADGGRVRRYYHLTADGRNALREKGGRVGGLRGGGGRVLGGKPLWNITAQFRPGWRRRGRRSAGGGPAGPSCGSWRTGIADQARDFEALGDGGRDGGGAGRGRDGRPHGGGKELDLAHRP